MASYPSSPKLTRRNSSRKTKISEDIELPKGLSEKILLNLECHFNPKWDICHLTESTLQERINAIRGHIEQNADNIRPQSYCTMAFLKSISKIEQDEKNLYEEVLEHLSNAKDSLAVPEQTIANGETWTIGLGYKAVVLGNLAVWEYQHNHLEEAENYYKQYQEIAMKRNLESHPEVLAMKAFALGYSNNHDRFARSVENYKKALSHKQYENYVPWLFGLAHSKSLTVRQKEMPDKDDLFDIECILRRVIKLNPSHALAMLRLAKTLIKTSGVQCFEEVKYWIDKALDTDGTKVSIIEEAGNIYLMTVRDKPENVDKAIELFRKSEAIKPESKNSVLGLGKSYFDKYRENNKRNNRKKKKEALPVELQNAFEYFEKIQNKRQTEMLKFAHMHQERSKYENKNENLTEAERIYKDVIQIAEQEDDEYKRVSAYRTYALFLRKQNRIKEEIEYLKKSIQVRCSTAIDADKSDRSVLSVSISSERITATEDDSNNRFVHECQEKLLAYASQCSSKTGMTENDALILKGFIQRQRDNIHSAVFYYKQAIDATSDEVTQQVKEDFVEMLLEASSSEYQTYVEDISQQYFEKAKFEVDKLQESKRKYDLQFQIQKSEINAKMNETTELKGLKDLRLKLEKHHRDMKKEDLKKKVSFSEDIQEDYSTENSPVIDQRKQREEEEATCVVKVLCESKRVLDRSINNIKVEIYEKRHDKPPHCYYPCPKNLNTLNQNPSQQFDKEFIAKEMKQLLTCKYQLTDFDVNHKEIFEFLVSKQPSTQNGGDYSWLQNIIDVRNNEEHFIGSVELLRKKFPIQQERMQLAQDVSSYAVEVWRRLSKEVKQFKRNKQNTK